MRLTKDQAEQMRCDLKCRPNEFGYAQATWTANCLARHLETRYQVVYAVRHCRRLILQAKSGGECVELPSVQKPVPATKPRVWSGFSDEYRHKKVLHRLRQPSSSGLPLKQFSENLFEQLTTATNCGEAMQMLGLDDPRALKFVFRDRETMEWTAANMHALELVNPDDLRLSGTLIVQSTALYRRSRPTHRQVNRTALS